MSPRLPEKPIGDVRWYFATQANPFIGEVRAELAPLSTRKHSAFAVWLADRSTTNAAECRPKRPALVTDLRGLVERAWAIAVGEAGAGDAVGTLLSDCDTVWTKRRVNQRVHDALVTLNILRYALLAYTGESATMAAYASSEFFEPIDRRLFDALTIGESSFSPARLKTLRTEIYSHTEMKAERVFQLKAISLLKRASPRKLRDTV